MTVHYFQERNTRSDSYEDSPGIGFCGFSRFDEGAGPQSYTVYDCVERVDPKALLAYYKVRDPRYRSALFPNPEAAGLYLIYMKERYTSDPLLYSGHVVRAMSETCIDYQYRRSSEYQKYPLALRDYHGYPQGSQEVVNFPASVCTRSEPALGRYTVRWPEQDPFDLLYTAKNSEHDVIDALTQYRALRQAHSDACTVFSSTCFVSCTCGADPDEDE